jgi:hypothetical protein
MLGTGSLSGDSTYALWTNCANAAPDAPTNVKEMQGFKTVNSLKFDWRNGVCEGNSPITVYTFIYNQLGVNSYERETVLADHRYHEISGLERDTVYQVRITATNIYGESAESAVVQARTSNSIGSSAPPAPTNLADDHKLRTSDSLTLTWDQPGNGLSSI